MADQLLSTFREEEDDDDSSKKEKRSSSWMSKSLRDFYESHGVDLDRLHKTYRCHDHPDASTIDDGSTGYRFVRLNPRYNLDETLKILKEELKCGQEPKPVPWLNCQWQFYAIPAEFGLAASNIFRSGRVYGMDVSSGASVAALLSKAHDKNDDDDGYGNGSGNGNDNDSLIPNSQVDDHKEQNQHNQSIRVLDLCCCPGLKLCSMADFLQTSNYQDVTIVGVDISEQRMALCKKIVQKYHIDQATRGTTLQKNHHDPFSCSVVKIQLYCQDGTNFGLAEPSENNLVFDSNVALEEALIRGKRKRMNKSARARERKRLKQLASFEGTTDSTNTNDEAVHGETVPKIKLFDHVLVDAECSTDGSLKHMKERHKGSTINKKEEEVNLMLTDQSKLSELVTLQKRLIASGFRLLKPGGTMVYSTCSLSKDQNEKVIEWLLQCSREAELIPVYFPLTSSKLVVGGSLDGTVRFYPNIGGQDREGFFGDGFFLAKIKKRQVL